MITGALAGVIAFAVIAVWRSFARAHRTIRTALADLEAARPVDRPVDDRTTTQEES